MKKYLDKIWNAYLPYKDGLRVTLTRGMAFQFTAKLVYAGVITGRSFPSATAGNPAEALEALIEKISRDGEFFDAETFNTMNTHLTPIWDSLLADQPHRTVDGLGVQFLPSGEVTLLIPGNLVASDALEFQVLMSEIGTLAELTRIVESVTRQP